MGEALVAERQPTWESRCLCYLLQHKMDCCRETSSGIAHGIFESEMAVLRSMLMGSESGAAGRFLWQMVKDHAATWR